MTQRDHAILEFERTWFTLELPKDVAIVERFELSPERYQQLLGELIDDPEALAVDPLVIRRLQRERDRRLQARLGGNRAAERNG